MMQSPPQEKCPWYQMPLEDIKGKLGLSSLKGLADLEAQKRLSQFGLNQLHEKASLQWYHVFLRQFTNLLIIILFIAALISLLLGEVTNAIAIILIVLLNGVLGAIQEWKAETAIQSLKKMLSHHCKVIRNDQLKIIDTIYLVPGDIVLLESGDRVPADLKLLQAVNLHCDESSLTGESIPIHKNTDLIKKETPISSQLNMAWMGTTVVNGSGRGLVVATGMQTEFGQIARLASSIHRSPTNLQNKLSQLAKMLAILAIGVSTFITFIGISTGKTFTHMFMEGVALAVAAVPEGLPAVVTITLAIGIHTMARRRALLRFLQAAETLGATSVICTDKTGTLTKNEMTVTQIWTLNSHYKVSGVGYDLNGKIFKENVPVEPQNIQDLKALFITGQLCNHAQLSINTTENKIIGDPTEGALLVVAAKAGLLSNPNAELIAEFSFNSTRKRMSVVAESDDQYFIHVKGATEVLINYCQSIYQGTTRIPLTDALRSKILKALHTMAQQGLRTLALATKTLPINIELTEQNVESELIFLGIVGIIDPPREQVKDSLELAQRAGIQVLMVTGDAADTALAIAKQIGLKSNLAITGSEIDKMSDEELSQAIDEGALFARTIPDHKMRIVKLLQAQEHIVAMTGDGINDAPALKQADVGIAMGIRGTDVAKAAADMILTDDDFSTIVGAVQEGRRQYANIQKFVRYLLSSNIGEVLAIFINIVIGGPLILLPVQILWINLVTDGLTAITLGLEKAEPDLMTRPPQPVHAPILDKKGVMLLLGLGLYIGLATLWVFQYYLNIGESGNHLLLANTMAFSGIVIFEKMNIFNFRSLKAPLYTIGMFSNKWLLLAISITVLLQICAVYHPLLQQALGTTALRFSDWVVIIALALPLFLLVEGYKFVRYHHKSDA